MYKRLKVQSLYCTSHSVPGQCASELVYFLMAIKSPQRDFHGNGWLMLTGVHMWLLTEDVCGDLNECSRLINSLSREVYDKWIEKVSVLPRHYYNFQFLKGNTTGLQG